MAASANDKFLYVGDPGTSTNLAGSNYNPGDTTVTVTTTTNWPTTTGVIFGMDEVTVNADGEQERVAGSYGIYAGVVTSATTLGSVSRLFGPARSYTAGATTRVYITVSSYHNKRLIEGILAQHNQDGTHAAVTATSLASTGSVTAGNGLTVTTGAVSLPNNSIDANELATNAITLGYAQITSVVNKATVAEEDIAGLSVTVTVPAGGRRIKITFWGPQTTATASTNAGQYLLREGATALTSSRFYVTGGQSISTPILLYSTVASAGSHTYKIAWSLDNTQNLALQTTATNPAFILVEAI